MKISKKAPLMAFLFGLGLVVSMSSFVKNGLNKQQATKTYYHYTDDQNFTTVTPSPSEYLACQPDNAAYCRVTYTGPTADLPAATSFAEGSIPAPASGVTRTLITANTGYVPL